MNDAYPFCPAAHSCLGSPPPNGSFFLASKKKQKMPAENFSFEASRLAWSVQPEKFVRPDLSKTGMGCDGLAGRKCISKQLQNNVNGSGVEGYFMLRVCCSALGMN